MIAAAVSALLLSPTADAGTTWGDSHVVGNGEVRVRYKTKHGAPDYLGVHVQRSAMENLDDGPHGHGLVFDLDLPDGLADDTAIEVIQMNWNPYGHPPAGIWDIPHFDWHFYMVDHAAINAIVPGDCNGAPLPCDLLDRALTPVPASEMPPGYADLGAVAPFMGNHLLDVGVNGPNPPKTYIYGAYDGALTFLEPMVTLDHLQNLQEDDDDECVDVPVPQTFPEAGYYPTSYCVKADDDDCDAGGCEVVISLEDWEWFDATAR